MAKTMTVSLGCSSDELRHGLTEIFSAHRDFRINPSGSAAAVDLLVLELDDTNPAHTLEVVRTTLNEQPQIEIALVAQRIDPQIMLEAFRSGVKEFLTTPINRQEVDQALERFRERYRARMPAADTQPGQVISIIGSKGGVGVTTVAVNLAAGLRQVDSTKSVAVVDLNLYDSDLPLYLDLSPSGSLRDLSEDVSRLDETILRTVLATHSTGLQLLASGYGGFMEMAPAEGAVSHILELMTSLFDYVIVDCGHVWNSVTREALERSSSVMVVTLLSVPAIRRTKQLIEYLHLQGSLPASSLVINRYLTKDEELLAQAEEVLHQKPAWLIPNNYGVVHQALDTGTPFTVVNPRTDVSKCYLKQAATLLGGAKESGTAQDSQLPTSKSSFFGRFLPRRS